MPQWIEDEEDDKGRGRRRKSDKKRDRTSEAPRSETAGGGAPNLAQEPAPYTGAQDHGSAPSHDPAPGRRQERDRGKGSRVGLIVGITVLVAALIAAGVVYAMNRGGDTAEPTDPTKQGQPPAGAEPPPLQVKLPKAAKLPAYPGKPTRIAGRVADEHSGLSYPRFAVPWQLPTRKNKLGTQGWSGQQVLVTEKRANRLWYGQLLTGSLQPSLMESYDGPEKLQPVTVMASDALLQRYYAFPHTKRPVASQQLNLGGRKGWLIGTQLRYKRPGVRATGELVVVAVIDTGRATPAVVFASIPNTHRKLWPDINRFVSQLKPLS